MPTLGTTPVRALAPQQVWRWYAGLDAENTRQNAQAYQLLHAVMKTAVTDGVLTANPCQIVRAMNGSGGGHRVMPTVDDVRTLADTMSPKFRVMVLLSAWCGLRHGEVAVLRRKDLGDDRAVLTVARAMTYRSGQTVIGLPKSGKARTVVVPPHIRDDLKHHLDVHVGDSDVALLFPRASGEHLTDVRDAGWSKAVDAVARKGVAVPRSAALRGDDGVPGRCQHDGDDAPDRTQHVLKAAMTYQAALDERDYEIAARLSRLAEGG